MAIITSSIGTSSRNYSTIQAWEDSIPGSMGSNSYVGECYNDSEFSVAGTVVTFAGSSTGASNTITLKCAAGQSFRDNANVQTNALRYNQSNGVALKRTSYAGNAVEVQEDYVFLDGLQITHTLSGAVFYSNSTSYTHNVYSNCILSQSSGGGVILASRAETWVNDLFIGGGSAGTAGVYLPYPGGVNFLNCTLVRPTSLSTSTTYGWNIPAGSGVPIKNCATFGYNSMVNNSSLFSGSNNCSDNTIGFGTSNQQSKTYANQFVNTTASSGDFKLKSGADCIDNGATDSSASPDIAGTTRPQGSAYDIGCWELVRAALTPKSIEADMIINN